MLGPFPTPEIGTESVHHQGDILRLESVSSAHELCRVLGQNYFDHLVEEQTAPRLPEVLENFATVRTKCAELAAALAHLSYAERYLLHTLWGIHPQASLERLMQLLDDMGLYGPPDPGETTDDQKLAPGALAELLWRLEEYVGKLHYIVKRRYTRKGTARVDLGGQTSAANIIAPNPRWHLIHESYEIFSRLPDHKITRSEDSIFQQFITAIHEWVTGESHVGLEQPIKSYMDVRKLFEEKSIELERLRTTDKSYTPEEFDVAVATGNSEDRIPPNVIQMATQLSNEIKTLSDRMSYGHRIPARDIVTG